MGKGSMYEALMSAVARELARIKFDLVAAEQRQMVKEDTGEIEKSSRYEVEVPKGNGELSRLRLTVKIIEEELKVNPAVLDEEQIYVQFSGLTISYIDAKRNIYFRADGIVVVKG